MNPIVFAVYGSLREGQFNYRRLREEFGHNSMKIVGSARLAGLALYSLGEYPAAVKHPGASIYVEFMSCSDVVASAIDRMERSAGYKASSLKRLTDVAGEATDKTIIYLMTKAPRYASLIEHGDWSRYLQQEE